MVQSRFQIICHSPSSASFAHPKHRPISDAIAATPLPPTAPIRLHSVDDYDIKANNISDTRIRHHGVPAHSPDSARALRPGNGSAHPHPHAPPHRASLARAHALTITPQASFAISIKHADVVDGILTPAPGVGDGVDARDVIYRRSIWTKIRDAFRSFGQKVKSGFQKAGQAIKSGFQKFGQKVKQGFQKVKQGTLKYSPPQTILFNVIIGFQKAGQAIKSVRPESQNGFQKAGHAIKSGFQKFGQKVKHGFRKQARRSRAKFGQKVKQGFQKAGQVLKKGFQKVGAWIKTTGAKIAKVGLKILSTVQKVLSKVMDGESAGLNALSDRIHVDVGGKLGKAMEGMDKARKIVGYIPGAAGGRVQLDSGSASPPHEPFDVLRRDTVHPCSLAEQLDVGGVVRCTAKNRSSISQRKAAELRLRSSHNSKASVETFARTLGIAVGALEDDEPVGTAGCWDDDDGDDEDDDDVGGGDVPR
ncbi:hypothetical protein BJ912DRAFT_1147186 [Pholiota molesta]|nr:hypothetical protein BJ912DRAFT_1148499 [Pholiota molesta]KAF8175353.1 hypothetical protein BJ912DRAFT_1147186 [Pholiota molesta]